MGRDDARARHGRSKMPTDPAVAALLLDHEIRQFYFIEADLLDERRFANGWIC